MFGSIRPHDPASPLTLALIFGYATGVFALVAWVWIHEHLKRRAVRMAARLAKTHPGEDLLPYREIPLQDAPRSERGDDRSGSNVCS